VLLERSRGGVDLLCLLCLDTTFPSQGMPVMLPFTSRQSLLLESHELNNPIFPVKGKKSEAKLREIYGKYLIAFLFCAASKDG